MSDSRHAEPRPERRLGGWFAVNYGVGVVGAQTIPADPSLLVAGIARTITSPDSSVVTATRATVPGETGRVERRAQSTQSFSLSAARAG